MRRLKASLLVVTVAVAVAAVDGAGTDSATLRRIGSSLDARIGTIAIEASDPVPYVATQPDPGTFVIELRDTVAAGFADGFTADPRMPFAAVKVEDARAVDGAQVARIRLTLSQPQRPRVRSARNVIYVEAERGDAAPSAAVGRISMAGRAAVIRDVRATAREGATALALIGTGPLAATSIQPGKDTRDGKKVLVIDLPNVTSAVPGVVSIAQGPVQRVRVGLNPKVPLMTQVTVELTRTAAYRVEPDGNNLTLVFDPPPLDEPQPASARQVPPSPPVELSAASAGQGPAPGRPAFQQAPPSAAPAAPQSQPVPQAPAAPQGVAGGQVPPNGTGNGNGAQRFTGHPVTLDFQDADLRAVLRSFSEISGLNIVIDSDIQGAVDIALRDIPWDQALDIILRANRLRAEIDGTIVRLAKIETLQAEAKAARELADQQAEAGELRTLTRALSYAKAQDFEALLKATVLSSRGDVKFDVRTNTIIVMDIADRLRRVDELLTTLDRPEPQVEIEARIVQTTRDFARNIGVQWGVNGRASQALGNTLPLAFPNQGSITGRTGITQGAPAPDPGTDAVSNMVNLGVTAATSGVGLALGSINGALNLDVALSALESTGQGRILSTPRVSTQNNIEAEIMQGIQIPIQTVANNTVTVTFRDASLILRVTPQITAANTVIMRIMVENSSPDFSRSVNNIPPIDTQRATTQVLVSTGETTVIGGIYISREQTSQDRTPGLHRLPLLGWLFKRNEFSDESRELLIFITPKIVRL